MMRNLTPNILNIVTYSLGPPALTSLPTTKPARRWTTRTQMDGTWSFPLLQRPATLAGAEQAKPGCAFLVNTPRCLSCSQSQSVTPYLSKCFKVIYRNDTSWTTQAHA